MRITIKQMTLQNFKGVLGERKIEFTPDVTEVYGANKTGKTTLADGFRWCLFGKNFEGAANFGIKTKDEHGNVIPQLEHSVELLLEVDGREVTLQRVLQEKWGKATGSAEKVLTGHTTLYYVDGNKYTEKDYKEYVATLCNEALFMCITNPMYFTSLKADQQRALLTKMVGEVSNETLAKGNEAFAALLVEMNGEPLERFMEHLSYQKKEIKEELERIPVRINEQQQEVATLMAAGTNWKELEADIQGYDSAIQRIDEEIADRSKVEDSKYEALAAERKAINELKEQCEQLEYNHKQAQASEQRTLNNKRNELQGAIDAANAEIKRCEAAEAAARAYIAEYEQEKANTEQSWEAKFNDFRARWAEVDKERFAYDEDSAEFVCPTCKRRLDEEDVQAAIERMQQNWNKSHAGKVEALNNEAARLKAGKAGDLQRMQQKYDTAKQQIDEAKAKVEAETEKRKSAELELEKLAATIIAPVADRLAGDSKLQSIKAEIESRTKALEEPKEQQGVVDATTGLKADKAQLQQQRDAKKLLLNNKQLIENKHKRIAELEGKELKLNEQLTELEGKEYTAQQLLEANITELEGKVNNLFTLVRFEMFDHKLNGTLKPTCECSVGGVPYSDLNNADRINAGIDIINAISRYNEIYAPCFIDNAESINSVMPMESQQILLRVNYSNTLEINPQY